MEEEINRINDDTLLVKVASDEWRKLKNKKILLQYSIFTFLCNLGFKSLNKILSLFFLASSVTF